MKSAHWPNAIVPFLVDSSLGEIETRAIQRAMDDFHRYTCIQWVPYHQSTHGQNHVRFFHGQGCYSYVGRNLIGAQPISIGDGCGIKGIVLHEMMHAIGFFHEHNRSDRDSFIKVIFENIRQDYVGAFAKVSPVSETMIGRYDYKSLMHYGKYFWSRNGRETMLSKISGVEIGNQQGFSSEDVYKINKLYNCDKISQKKPIATTTTSLNIETSTSRPKCLLLKNVASDTVCDQLRKYCRKFDHMKQFCARSCECDM